MQNKNLIKIKVNKKKAERGPPTQKLGTLSVFYIDYFAKYSVFFSTSLFFFSEKLHFGEQPPTFHFYFFNLSL